MPTAEPMPIRRPVLRAPPAKPPRRQAAAPIERPPPVEYPESDGKPMSEAGIHWRATVDFASPLMTRYAARPDAYVGSDMLMYYEEGDVGQSVSPDVFVALGPSRDPVRRTWLVWEEGKAADFVLEVTSKWTRGRDDEFKAGLYERLKVTEYWQFDPTEDYLRPPLKGRRLGADGTYETVSLERRGGGLVGWSEVLSLELRPEGESLRLFDPALGDYLPNHAEAVAKMEAANAKLDALETARHEEAKARREEAEARRAAEARVAELERRLAEGGTQ